MNNNDTDPKTLYHYTDAGGLIGILKPSSWDIGDWPEFDQQLAGAAQLRASDVRYMNDSQELSFGARYFVAGFKAAATDRSLSDDARRACSRLASVFGRDDLFSWQFRCFAACFCAHGDLLSQWRGYAGGAGGYAIGFSRDALAYRSFTLHYHQLTTTTVDKADLRPVKYGPIEAAKLADAFIDSMRNPDEFMGLMIRGSDNPAHKASTQEQGLWWIAGAALREIISVKDEGFQEELEWRLHHLDGELQNPVKIRTGRPGIVPYLNMAVNMKAPGQESIPPAIDRLVVGPGHNQKNQIAAAQELLKVCGYDPDIVVESKISFTG